MIETTILGHLIFNGEYGKRVFPFLKPEYFTEQDHRIVFDLVSEYVGKYQSFPSKETLLIELAGNRGMSERAYETARDAIAGLEPDPKTSIDWLIGSTEKFCKDKAIYNAVLEAIKIIDPGANGKFDVGNIPQIMTDALSVSFDSHIGHDFLEDAEQRYEYYHRKEIKIPFDLDYLNRITLGGVTKKTLNVILAGTNAGKSLFMCHAAAANLVMGKNVLYITLEMAEERIAERIDANLLDTPVAAIKTLELDKFNKKIEAIKRRTKGKLIIKEYPTTTAHAGHFRTLLNELRLKKNFAPDIIYIDYINICASSRFKAGANVNSYTIVKAIAEEIRGLAVEFGVPIITATQTNRTGFGDSDVGLENTSESFGLPQTADLMFALIRTEELDELGQVLIKQLKNRYADVSEYRRFVIGLDRKKMRFFDVEQEAQDDLNEGPVMDNTEFGERAEEEGKKTSKFKFDRSKFKDFK
jgi:archaellum biogenesis ATPase FlaH